MSLMEPGSIAILPAASIQRRNGDVNHRFRQDSNFYYLTGFNEPESVFVLVPGRAHGETILFCRERDQVAERWHGEITGPGRAMQLYGFDDSFPISDIDDILPGLIEGRGKLYYAMGMNRDFDNQIIEWVNLITAKKKDGAEPPGEFIQLGHYLHELRLFKSKKEIQIMHKAARISAEAHCRMMQSARPGMTELQLQAEFNYAFMQGGAHFAAYPPIVGSGENACVLHYTDNSAELKDGDLVLVDAGCEYEFYASDVTRTFPVNGKFSDCQRKVYEIVLNAQKAAIRMIKPGNHWNQPHEEAIRVITAGLLDIGLLEGDVDELMEKEAYKKFYMHKTGHWLGLDVHDVGEYQIDGEWRVFERGMITTVEPGIYISESLADVPSKWRGIGIRIEDDVLVTGKGNEVLSDLVPREIEDLERLMSGSCH